MQFDHVALTSKNIKNSVDWYVEHYNATIVYQDDTWAIIEVGGTKISFVIPTQHPPHICFEVDQSFIEKNLKKNVFKEHRDGSKSCYVKDIDGNFLEFLSWKS